nr:Chain B, Venezuelan equine encephalitis virus capsid protein NLS [Venezuelan equine encephalitis virus]
EGPSAKKPKKEA